MYLDVHEDMTLVLHGKDQHPYPCAAMEFSHRIRAPISFTSVELAEKHVPLKNRLKLFQAVVTPVVVYGLSTMPLTDKQFTDLDVVQHRMLRSIVG